jgi:hypothetical protein
MRLRDLYSFKFGDWIDIVREIGEDLVTKYKEYLAECLGVTVGELREKVEELSESDFEFLANCQNTAELDAWGWVNRNWGWRVGRRVWDEVDRYFQERRYELGI